MKTITEIDQTEVVKAIQCDVVDVFELFKIKDNDFTLIAQNIRSINFNFNDLLVTIAHLKFEPDVIILTECWLSKDKPIPTLANYKMFSSTRYLNKSDGVVVYVNAKMSADVIEIPLQEASCLQIRLGNNTILAIYRSPSNTNADPFIGSLDAHLEAIKQHKFITIAGDININTIPRDTEQSYERKNRTAYLNMLATHSIMMGHNFPTRENSSLDHIMLKVDGKRTESQVAVLNTSVTDHALVLLHRFNQMKDKTNCKKVKKLVDYDGALDSLKGKNLTRLLHCNDPEKVTNQLTFSIIEALTENTKEIRIRKKDRVIKPWITPGILRCIRHRNKLQQRLRCNPNDEILKITYRRYRNFCNNLIKKLKQDYERQLLQNSTGSPKDLWKNIGTIANFKQSRSDNTKLLNIKSSPKDSVDHVNRFFGEIGKNLADAINKNSVPQYSHHDRLRPSQLNSFALIETDLEEVHSVLMNLKSDSAPGWDNIPTNFLKRARNEVVPIITHLANLCFSKGIFPSLLKESIVTPIYKSGDGDDVNNYRPISVLPSLSKVLERLINKRLLSYLEKNKILSASQFGFRAGKCTEDAVSALTSLITDKLDKNKKCLAVFLDLKKAFDTVSVSILVQKLENIGVRGIPLDLFKSYMRGRKQRVQVKQTVSEITYVDYGVPQGSVLGPTLFLVYINDLCNFQIKNTQIFSYADDTAVVFSGDSWNSIKTEAELGMRQISEWLRANLLTLNTQKTNYMSFSIYDRNQPDDNYEIKIHTCRRSQKTCSCPVIDRVSEFKYLGVMVDQRLSWQSHIDLVASRLRKLIWIFKTLRHVATKKLLNHIYVALVQSIIIYSITVWGGALKTKLLGVERAQRALLKTMLFKKRRFSTQSLYSLADLLTIRKLFILHVVLRKHKSLEYNSKICQKRRKHKVIVTERTRTNFAQNQSLHLSNHLYNRINKILEIYPLNYRECKIKLTEWLKPLEYLKTENLLKYN